MYNIFGDQLVHCCALAVLPSSVMMQASTASRAPVLRPAGREKATDPHASGTPSASHWHTRTERVLVLLKAGLPLSTISTGNQYRDCSRLRKPARLVSTDAVLSERDGQRSRVKGKNMKLIVRLINMSEVLDWIKIGHLTQRWMNLWMKGWMDEELEDGKTWSLHENCFCIMKKRGKYVYRKYEQT